VTLQNPTLLNAQIVLNTHAEATFQIPDVTKSAGGAGPVEDCTCSRRWAAIAQKIEGDLLNLYADSRVEHPRRWAAAVRGDHRSHVDAAETELFWRRLRQSEPRVAWWWTLAVLLDVAADPAFQRSTRRRATPGRKRW